MLQEFIERYNIDLAAVARIRKRVMLVGRFNREREGGKPELFLFTKANVSPTYISNFQGKFSISYESFVEALRPAIAEKVQLDGRFPSVKQVIPSEAGAGPGSSVLDQYNWFFQRAVANSAQKEFQQDAGGQQLLTGGDNERGKAILKQIRANLKTFGGFQPRTHEIVQAAAELLYACAGFHNMPASYAPGDALPVGFAERLIDFVYDENLSKSFQRFTDGIDFSGEVWKNVNREMFCNAMDALRSVLVTGSAAQFSVPEFGQNRLSTLAKRAVPDDLQKEFKAARNAYNGLRQMLRSKVLLSMILEWIVRSLYELETVKAQPAGAKRDAAASNAILKDHRVNGMAAPVLRPSETEREEFKALLATNYERMLDAVTASEADQAAKLQALPPTLRSAVENLRKEKDTIAALNVVAGPGQTAEMRRAFIDATKTIMIDVMCPVLYRSPVLSEQQLRAFFRREAISAYLTAILLDDKNQSAVRQIAETHLAFFEQNIDPQTKQIREKDAITSRLLSDYLRSIANPQLQRQLVQGMKELEEVLALLDASEADQRQTDGDQRLGAGSISAIRLSEGAGQEDQLEQTAPATSTIRVAIEARAQQMLEKVLGAAPSVAPSGGDLQPAAVAAVPSGGGAPAPAGPAPVAAKKSEGAAASKTISEIDARLESLLRAATSEPGAVALDAEGKKKVVGDAVKKVLADKTFVGGLSEQLKAFEKTLHMIYTRYNKNPDEKEFRNKVDRLTMINLMLLFQKDLGLGKVQSSLYQLLLDVIQYTDSENPSPKEFLANHSLTAYFDDNFDQRGFTSLVRTLEVQAVESLKNTVHFVSELRGVKYLMDKVKDDPEAEIIVVNATAAEFQEWLYNDNFTEGSPGRMRSGGLVTTDNAAQKVIQPAMIYMTDLAFDVDDGGQGAKQAWLAGLANFNLRENAPNQDVSILLPPICVSTGAASNWQAVGQTLLDAGANAPAGIVVIGPSPKLNRDGDGFPTVLPAGYLLCAHIMSPTDKPLTIPGQLTKSSGRRRAVGYGNVGMNATLDQVIWGEGLKTNPVGAGDTYCFAADFYAYLVLTLMATARRCGAQHHPETTDYYNFYYSQDAELPAHQAHYESSQILNAAVIGGQALRFALGKDLHIPNNKPLCVYVGANAAQVRNSPTPPAVSDITWFDRAREKAGLP